MNYQVFMALQKLLEEFEVQEMLLRSGRARTKVPELIEEFDRELARLAESKAYVQWAIESPEAHAQYEKYLISQH